MFVTCLDNPEGQNIYFVGRAPRWPLQQRTNKNYNTKRQHNNLSFQSKYIFILFLFLILFLFIFYLILPY
jgi:hypothetical protein